MSNDVAIARNALSEFFDKNKQQIQLALPKHLNPDRMCRLALTAFSQNRDLQECSITTIFASVVIASQLGLEIGVAGQGFLVPYKGKCTFVPGWQGLVDLVSRSGRATVWTGAVYEGDDFDWALGDRPFVKHKPKSRAVGGVPTHTYSVGRQKGAEWPVIEVWDQASLQEHRDKFNKVGGNHYSFKNWEMYARKVPLLQVIKYLPKSIELANAIALEGAYAEGKGVVLEGDIIRVEEDAPDIQTAIEQPKAKSESASPATPAPTTSANQNSSSTDGGGTGPTKTESEHAAEYAAAFGDGKTEARLLQDGQKRILRARLKNAGLTEIDLEAKFGKLDELPFARFEEVQQWAQARA